MTVAALSIEQVLVEEARAIRGTLATEAHLTHPAKGQEAQIERVEKNADRRDGKIFRLRRSSAGRDLSLAQQIET